MLGLKLNHVSKKGAQVLAVLLKLWIDGGIIHTKDKLMVDKVMSSTNHYVHYRACHWSVAGIWGDTLLSCQYLIEIWGFFCRRETRIKFELRSMIRNGASLDNIEAILLQIIISRDKRYSVLHPIKPVVLTHMIDRYQCKYETYGNLLCRAQN